jgi:hypothetical protein
LGVTFGVLYVDEGNFLNWYERREDAEAAVLEVARRDPGEATAFGYLAYDGAGEPQGTFVSGAALLEQTGETTVLATYEGETVVNVSGHRMSTAEIESALVSHELVAEAAVIGQSDEDTGQAIWAFVTLKGPHWGSDELVVELRERVATRIGELARPKRIIWADDLPKTHSGKIMRRLLRDIAEGHQLGTSDTDVNIGRLDVEQRRQAGMAGEERHVVPSPDGGWDVVKPGSSRASSHHDTQAQAEARAKEILGNIGGGEAVIHGRDNKIRDKDTVAPARDPFPPRDRKH